MHIKLYLSAGNSKHYLNNVYQENICEFSHMSKGAITMQAGGESLRKFYQ